MMFDFIFETEEYKCFEKALIDIVIDIKVYCDLHPIYLYKLLEAPIYDKE